ncbi:hypothetical protein EA881_03015 [Salmonella enterica]|nr:hypothetical protein [Salmonella enterica]
MNMTAEQVMALDLNYSERLMSGWLIEPLGGSLVELIGSRKTKGQEWYDVFSIEAHVKVDGSEDSIRSYEYYDTLSEALNAFATLTGGDYVSE